VADTVRTVPASASGGPATGPASWLPAGPPPADSAPLGPVERAALAPLRPDFYAAEDAPQRPRAVEYSEAYHVRLAIPHIARFATVPLFVAQYLLGRKLFNDPPGTQSQRQTHRAVALGVASLVSVNTVTGAWNLWDSRKTSAGALRRYLHAGLMFAADAGFVATALAAPRGARIYTATQADRNRHRTLALTSMGTALASYAMMLVWRN
jgi:hypothetical protein